MEAGTLVTARRDRLGKEGKEVGPWLEPSAFVERVSGLLEEIQVRTKLSERESLERRKP